MMPVAVRQIMRAVVTSFAHSEIVLDVEIVEAGLGRPDIAVSLTRMWCFYNRNFKYEAVREIVRLKDQIPA